MASNPAGHGQIILAPNARQAGQAAAPVTTGTSGAASTSALNLPVSQALPRGIQVAGGGRDD
jgi:hypothetical protein